MSKSDSLFRYWGKAEKKPGTGYHLLVYHSLDVAAVGNCILHEHPLLVEKLSSGLSLSPDRVIPFVTFLLSIHDLGKWSEGFQGLVKDLYFQLNGRSPKFDYLLRHDSLGLSMLQEGMLEQLILENDEIFGKGVFDDFLYGYGYCLNAVFGHHGMPPDQNKISLTNLFEVCTKEDYEAAYSFIEKSAQLFLKNITRLIPLSLDELSSARISWLLSGLIIISDWIASSDLFPFKKSIVPLELYWNESLQIAKKALPICGLSRYPVVQETGIRSLFPSFSKNGKTPSPLQEMVSSCEIGSGPHLFIIEESTGGGKTEAAVTLAHRLMAEGCGEGIYVGLPTMATANAMYERMKECYQRLYQDGKPSLILAHGSSYLSDSFMETVGPPGKMYDSDYERGEESGEAVCSRWIADHRKSSLIASVGVGTIDQGLTGVLPVKHQSLRIFGLAKNVLIVDEVHAYDRYMNRLLQSLLSFQAALGGSAILLSATLPKNQKAEYLKSFAADAGNKVFPEFDGSYPLVTHLNKERLLQLPVSCRDGTERNVEVEFFHSIDEVVDYLENVLSSGKCACWIRNTVNDAVLAYQIMEKRGIASKLMLFHARFAMGDRLEKEREVLRQFGLKSTDEERKGVLLIATQVVEQSLDLDFDEMVTDLAPIDLIIQRAGRLHRHNRGKRNNSVLGVFSPPFDDNPEENWYSELFPGGAFVYKYHGKLWLTSEVLRSEGSINTPGRSRFLIESVYGEKSSSLVPSGLVSRDEKTSLEDRRAEGLAKNRVLEVDHGYELESGLWGEDDVDQTRLSDPTILIRLFKWDPDTRKLTHWKYEETHPAEMSQVQVSLRRFDLTLLLEEEVSIAVEQMKESLPDKGKWSKIVPLMSGGDYYYCRAVDSDGREKEIRYSMKTGLSIKVNE